MHDALGVINLKSSGVSIYFQNQGQKGLAGPKSEDANSFKTFIVFGVPRGGTTMVARVVESLGVNLGSDLPANYEDTDFNFDFLPKDLKKSRPALIEQLSKVIDQRNQDLDVWGWKYPRAAIYLIPLLKKLRNPHLICVMRDPISSGIRNMKRAQKIHKKSLSKADFVPESNCADIPSRIITQHLEIQLKNMRTIQQASCPSFLCSYEKAIMNTDDFVREMAEFLDVSSTEQQIQDAIHQVKPGGYMQV